MNIYLEIFSDIQCVMCCLLIPHQSTKKKTRLTAHLITPDYVLCRFGLIIPVAQKVAKAVMKQADFPSLVRFVTLSWTLGQILIIVGHPTDGNPVLRLLTLVFVQVENRH